VISQSYQCMGRKNYMVIPPLLSPLPLFLSLSSTLIERGTSAEGPSSTG